MAARKALLLVAMEPPAGMEEEFNDGYDTEHFPQRCSLPGFDETVAGSACALWLVAEFAHPGGVKGVRRAVAEIDGHSAHVLNLYTPYRRGLTGSGNTGKA